MQRPKKNKNLILQTRNDEVFCDNETEWGCLIMCSDILL